MYRFFIYTPILVVWKASSTYTQRKWIQALRKHSSSAQLLISLLCHLHTIRKLIILQKKHKFVDYLGLCSSLRMFFHFRITLSVTGPPTTVDRSSYGPIPFTSVVSVEFSDYCHSTQLFVVQKEEIWSSKWPRRHRTTWTEASRVREPIRGEKRARSWGTLRKKIFTIVVRCRDSPHWHYTPEGVAVGKSQLCSHHRRRLGFGNREDKVDEKFCRPVQQEQAGICERHTANWGRTT